MISIMTQRRVLKSFCDGFVLLHVHHWWGVRVRWNPPLEVLVFCTTKLIFDKEVPWVKLVRTINPLEKVAPLLVLNKIIQSTQQ